VPLPDDVQYADSDNRDMGAFEVWPADPQDFFRRGDANQSGLVELGDPNCILNAVSGSGCAALTCFDAADANDDGVVDLSDATFLFLFLFDAGRPPPLPGPGFCGPDPTPEQSGPGSPPDVTCNSYSASCTSLDDLIDEGAPDPVGN
jgi:hypothetical protein